MTADAVLHARPAIAVPKDWSDVARVRLLVQQEYRYAYTAPITDIRQRLIMVPPERYGDQELRSHELTVDGAEDVVVEWENDRFGNRACKVRASRVEESVRFAVEFEVERLAPPTAQRLRANASVDPFIAPTALTAPDDRIREAGAALLAALPHAPVPEEIVPLDSHALRQWMLAKAIKYQHGQTGVQTPAAMALHLGGGVCQDYAHIAIAVLRTLGVPARYVSGHVLGEGRHPVGHRCVALVCRSDACRCGRFEEVEHRVDVRLLRRVVENAEAQYLTAVDARRRHEADPARLERGDEPVHLVVIAIEADDAQGRRRCQSQPRAPLDASHGVLGEVERAIDRGTEPVDPEGAQRQPQLERARRPREWQSWPSRG